MLIRKLATRITRLHPGQLALLWVVAGITAVVGAWTIVAAPGEYERDLQAAARDDSVWDAYAAESRAAADSARQDLQQYYLIRAHEPQVYWPFLDSDTMALKIERVDAKDATVYRLANREILAAEQRHLDARSAAARWAIALALASVVVVSWVWFAARPTLSREVS